MSLLGDHRNEIKQTLSYYSYLVISFNKHLTDIHVCNCSGTDLNNLKYEYGAPSRRLVSPFWHVCRQNWKQIITRFHYTYSLTNETSITVLATTYFLLYHKNHSIKSSFNYTSGSHSVLSMHIYFVDFLTIFFLTLKLMALRELGAGEL